MRFLLVFSLIVLWCSCKTDKTFLLDTRISYTQHEPVNLYNSPVPAYKSFTSFKNDTASYLRFDFIERKNAYIGKELNVLLKDLEIPLLRFTASLDQANLKGSGALYLHFNGYLEDRKKLDNKITPNLIVVYWKSPIPADEVIKLIRSNKSRWNADADQLFSKRLVGNIEMIEF